MASEKIVTESALTALASDAKRAIYDVLPGGSATGNPCNFDTDIAVPLKSLIANIVASGGNGTPSTPIPIVGHSELNLVRCGKNLFDVTLTSQTVNDVAFTVNSDKTIAANGTANGNIFLQIGTIHVVAGQTYTLTGCPSGGGSGAYSLYAALADGNKNDYGSGITFTTTLTEDVPVRIAVYNTKTINGTYKPQIELGSTATAYAPYNGETFTVSFGQTVYGGVYDANAGKVRITHELYDLGELNYALGGNDDKCFAASGLSSIVKHGPYWTGEVPNMKCDIFTADIGNRIYMQYADNIFGFDNNGRLYIYGSSYVGKTPTEFKTAMSGHYLAYELATPIEIDVSELSVNTLVGTNNIISDCGGDVEVEYRESVEKYVNDHSATRTDVVGTLTAGQTSITLSSTAITTSSTIEVFTDPEVPYNSLTVTSGQAVLTFDAQANNVSVKVRVT